MEKIKGFTVLTDTISGYELVWRLVDSKGDMPEYYGKVEGAYKAIAEDLIDQLQEVVEGNIEFEEVDFGNIVGKIEVSENWLTVYTLDDILLIDCSLEEWRNSF